MSGRGGARPGAGRKAVFDLSKEQRERLIADVEAVAAEHGTSVGQELASMMFGKNKDKRLKLAAMQLYVRDVLPKASEQQVEQKNPFSSGPLIFNPEMAEELRAMLDELHEAGLPTPAICLPEMKPVLAPVKTED